MTPLRRMLGGLVLAGLLASGLGMTAAPATAAGGATAAPRITRAEICAHLADYIKRLQAFPPGPLRDLLLRVALDLQAQYCR